MVFTNSAEKKITKDEIFFYRCKNLKKILKIKKNKIFTNGDTKNEWK